jgi:hypothetical protein
MRTLLKVQIPVEAGNAAITQGTLPTVLQGTLGQLQPEASYFFSAEGQRSAFIVFDLSDPSQIPVIAEPLFQGLNAHVEFIPVMNLDDLQAGLDQLGGGQSQ